MHKSGGSLTQSSILLLGPNMNADYVRQIINLTQSEMVLELTGSPEKLDAFLGMLSTYEIIDICRTGVTGIEK